MDKAPLTMLIVQAQNYANSMACTETYANLFKMDNNKAFHAHV